MNNTATIAFNDFGRPWWSVRFGLLAILTTLVMLLVTLLSKPELLDRSMGFAGL